MSDSFALNRIRRAARGGLARIGRMLADADEAGEAVFSAAPRPSPRSDETERRIATAKEARSGGGDRSRRN
jgi:hypothetical protein